MSLIAVGSVTGAPGATTLALALALQLAVEPDGAPGPILLDADVDGGDLALRLGLDPIPGLGTLALAGRHGLDEDTLVAHSQRARGLPGVDVVPGIAGRAQAPTLEWVASPLAALAPRCRRPLLVDVGRVGAATSSRPILTAADRVLVVCRSDTASVVHARSGMAALAAAGLTSSAVVVAGEHHLSGELAAALGRPIAAAISPERLQLATRRPAPPGQGPLAGLVDQVLRGAPPQLTPELPAAELAPDAVVAAAGSLPGRLGGQA